MATAAGSAAAAEAAAATRAATMRLVCGLHSMNTVMLKATSAMQASSTLAVISQLEALGAELEQVSLKLAEDFLISGQDWIKRWIARGSTSAGGLHATTTISVASFAKCLQAAMAKMQTHQSAADLTQPGTNASRVIGFKHFLTTWLFARELCITFTSCALFAEGPAQPDLRPLQPALSTLMAWLLQLSRYDKATQKALQEVLKGRTFEHMYNFIETGLFLLHTLKGMPVAETQRAFNHLPPGFVSTLFCLACEVAPWPEQSAVSPHGACLEMCAHRYKCLIHHLGQVLTHFVPDPEDVPSAVTVNPELFCPAAVEVAKRSVFACYTTPHTNQDQTADAQVTLMRMLTLSMSAAGNTLFCSPQASLLHSMPSTSTSLNPRRVTKDRDMLLLLSRCCIEHPQRLECCTQIMLAFVASWLDDAEMFMTPNGPACAALVLRHCSHHLCCLIKQQRCEQHQELLLARLPCSDDAPLLGEQALPLEGLMLLTMEILSYRVFRAGPPGTLTPAQDTKMSKMWATGAFKKLMTWIALPSPGMLLEIILRHKIDVTSESYRNETAMPDALDYLVQQYGFNPQRPTFASNISCLVSIHKLLLSNTLTMHDVHPSRSFRSLMGKKPDLSNLTKAHTRLQDLLAMSFPKCKETGLWQRPANHSSMGSTPPAAPSGQNKHVIHQLRAVVVMVLVWLGNLSRRMMVLQPEFVDCTVNKLMSWTVMMQAHDAELAGVAGQLSLPRQPEQWGTITAAFKRECVVWDEYARRHFHGRLLPGCSYLGCTNMNGTSERSLPTLLCSGCRRMRYCGTECQHAAWSIGGHSHVCGNGKWVCQGVLE